jgi:hypothetical protein
VTGFVVLPTTATRQLFAAPIAQAELVYLDEGAAGTVTVHRYPATGWRTLSVGGIPVAGEAPPLRSTQVLQGLIPTLLHPDPRHVLQVGLGSGETAAVALALGVDRLECVEIAPGVAHAARTIFSTMNNGVIGHERFALWLGDGKSFLRHERRSFDLILSESTYPFLSGSSGLYTLDYFERCRDRLAPNGMLSVWLPLDVPSEGTRTIARTFAEAFPHATLWTTSGYGYKHALLLGSADPIRIDYAELRERTSRPATGELLATVGIESVEEFIAGLVLDRDGLVRYAGGNAELHTDDRPILEYQTSLRSGAQWRSRLAMNLAELGELRVPLLKSVDLRGFGERERLGAERALGSAELDARRTLGKAVARLNAESLAIPILMRARTLQKAGKWREAAREYHRAHEICPFADGVPDAPRPSRPGPEEAQE